MPENEVTERNMHQPENADDRSRLKNTRLSLGKAHRTTPPLRGRSKMGLLSDGFLRGLLIRELLIRGLLDFRHRLSTPSLGRRAAGRRGGSP